MEINVIKAIFAVKISASNKSVEVLIVINNFSVMKIAQRLAKNLPLKIAVLLVVLTAACKHKEAVTPAIGSLAIYNMSPTFSTYDVSVNGLKLNTSALPFGGGIKYTQMLAGNYAVKFSTAGGSDNVFTKEGVNIGSNTFHSVYLLGTSGNFEALYVQDNFENTAITKSYVRFINLSPDATALSLSVKDATVPMIANKTYKSYGNFVELEPGAKILEVKEASSGLVKSTLESTNLEAGRFYTVIARGKANPANGLEHPFSSQIILHQ